MTARRRSRVAALVAGGLAALLASACGGDDFANKPRPPVPVQLTGVITKTRVTVSPDNVGAGPIILTISNQTPESHTVTLEGRGVRERVGPVNPLDTATIQKTLPSGSYEVKAGSEQAVPTEIASGALLVGPARPSGSDRTLLP